MAPDPKLVFFHSPLTRSAGVRVLLEELGAEYELRALNMKNGEQRASGFLAVNPMGKVPAILHGEALVTEQPAVYIYLADLFPQAGLAPAIGDPLRGPYLRWMVFYGTSFEPALVDWSMKREPAAMATSPYGDWDTMFSALAGQLEKGPWMLGSRFTALDVLWGSALTWTTMFKLVPELPFIKAYIERFNARPAVALARGMDDALAASQAAPNVIA